MQAQFSTEAVTIVTGASRRQLGYWAQTGLLRPSASDATGRGSRRKYTFRDIVAAMTILQLRERGCPLQKIRRAVVYLRKHYPSQPDAAILARLTLITDGQSVYILSDERQAMDLISRQHCWTIALGQLIQHAESEIKTLPAEWPERVQVGGQTYTLIISRDLEEGGFIVQCRELPGALSQGETVEEAITNGKDAVQMVQTMLARRARRAAPRRPARSRRGRGWRMPASRDARPPWR